MKSYILTAMLVLGTGALAEGHQEKGHQEHKHKEEHKHKDEHKHEDDKHKHDEKEHHHDEDKHKHDEKEHHHENDDHKHDEHKEGEKHKEGEDHDHEEHHVVRLIVSDGHQNKLRVINAKTGKEETSFGVPGKTSGLYTGPSGFYAYGIHRDDNRVTVLHSGLGLEDHGDHQDLIKKPSYIISTLNIGKKPTHFFKGKDKIVIFNDADGTAAVFGEALLGVTNDMKFLKASQPDHAAPAVMGHNLLLGLYKKGHVEVLDIKSGKLFKTVEGCKGVHGQAVYKNIAYFGCGDGVLAVNVYGKVVRDSKILNPAGTPEKIRVGKIVANDQAKHVFGNFGENLAYWEPGAKTLSVLKLPSRPVRFQLTEDGKQLLLLTMNGQLHSIDTEKVKVTKSISAVAPVSAEKKNQLFSSMVIGEEYAYLTNPNSGEVLKVALNGLKIAKRFKVEGAPTLITLTEAEGVAH